MRMNKLRKRLFMVIGSLVLAAIVISVCFNVSMINAQKKIKEQTYQNSMRVYMQSMEDSMADIENMLAIESTADADLKIILKSSDSLEQYLALVRKKTQMETEIKKYQMLDGLFLYDSRKNLFIGTKGTFAAEEDHTIIKQNTKGIIHNFQTRENGNEWIPVRLRNQYYLFRILEVKGIYFCAWIMPEHLMLDFENEKEQYFLCDQDGNVLNRQENVLYKDICEMKEKKEKANHVVLSSEPGKKFTLYMVKKDTFFSEFEKNVIAQVLIIFMLGGLSFLAVWSFTREMFLEPLHSMFFRKELEKKQAELQFLQVQNNPHFLNNCLSLIRSLMMFHQYDEAEKALFLLSDYSRRTLHSNALITVREEVAHIDDYYKLQKMRLDREIRLEVFMEDGMENEKMPFMILYTFVENSIKHANVEGKTSVIVDGEYLPTEKGARGKMQFQIMDNGSGFKDDVLEQIGKGQSVIDRAGMEHIGISNVVKRLRLIYGEEFQIYFSNEEGAVVTIILPVKGEEEGA